MAQHEYGMIMNSFDNVEQSRFVYGGQHDYFFPEELISPSESNFFEENANYIMRPETDDSDDPLYYSIGLFMNGVGNHDDYTTDHHQMGIYYNTELSHDESSNNTTITTSTGSHYSIGESLFVHHPPVAVAAGEADIYNDGSFCNMAMMQYNDDDQAAILSLNSYNLLMNYGIGDTKQFGSSISTANLMATDDDNSKSEGPYIIDNIHPKCSVEESSSCTKSKKRGRGSESEVSRRKVRKNVKYSKGKINTKIAADEINVEIAKDNDTNATETMVLDTSDQDEIGVNEGQEKPTINKTEKVKGTISRTGSSMSIYAKKRREKINERLRILQGLVPNGKKLDMSTMLEEAVHYVKFLQQQIKMLSSDDLWMYAPIVHN